MAGVLARFVLLAVVLASVALFPATEAQEADCVSKLVPCFSFLNSTAKPSTECCGSIKEAVDKQLACLCNIYSSPGLLAQFNVSVPQALGLSQRCGVPTDLSACKGAGGAPSPAGPDGSSLQPPGTPGSDKGAAGKIAYPAISTVVLSLVSMVFY